MEKEVKGVDFAVPNFVGQACCTVENFKSIHIKPIFMFLQDGDEVFPNLRTFLLDVKDGFEHIGVTLFK